MAMLAELSVVRLALGIELVDTALDQRTRFPLAVVFDDVVLGNAGGQGCCVIRRTALTWPTTTTSRRSRARPTSASSMSIASSAAD